MKLFVTGGCGFIGSNFIRFWLRQHPADAVVNLDALTYAGNRANLSDVEGDSRYRFVHGDVTDPSAVESAMKGCETVVHCAAETHVDRSITHASAFLRTNVEGTGVILECARRQNVQRVLHVSTDEIYGSAGPTGAFAESDPFQPTSPYSASKAAADLLAQSYVHTYRLPVVIARPSNNFGPYQFPEKFMPLFITNALEDQPVPVYGDGQQRRNWLFVEDTCRAFETLLQRGVAGNAYNIATPWELPNLDVARTILKLTEKPERLLMFVQDRPGHDRRYALRWEKIQALGWQPTVDFQEALAATVEWYRQHRSWWNPLRERLRDDPYHWLNRPAGSSAPQAASVLR